MMCSDMLLNFKLSIYLSSLPLLHLIFPLSHWYVTLSSNVSSCVLCDKKLHKCDMATSNLIHHVPTPEQSLAHGPATRPMPRAVELPHHLPHTQQRESFRMNFFLRTENRWASQYQVEGIPQAGTGRCINDNLSRGQMRKQSSPFPYTQESIPWSLETFFTPPLFSLYLGRPIKSSKAQQIGSSDVPCARKLVSRSSVQARYKLIFTQNTCPLCWGVSGLLSQKRATRDCDDCLLWEQPRRRGAWWSSRGHSRECAPTVSLIVETAIDYWMDDIYHMDTVNRDSFIPEVK